MTAYLAYLIKFLFRIKWWLIIFPLLVAFIVYNYMGKQAHNYKSTTTIYTGVVSGYNLESGEGSSQDWNVVNNAMDNLVNIIRSQTTLHNVSMRLYALNMTKGDAEKDNNYILSSNYRDELKRTPKEVLDLIDRNDSLGTIKRLMAAAKQADHGNHVYGLFHWNHRFYSHNVLSRIEVKRITNSDMLEISYENSDPGVVFNTLQILNEEFVSQYKDLRFGETNSVIKFFEEELARVGKELHTQEDSLRDYNIANLIINYDEQTKHVTILSRDFELQQEATRLNLNSAEMLRTAIEKELGGLTTFKNNSEFIRKLNTIGDLQSRITTAEAFSSSDITHIPTKTTENISVLKSRLTIESDSLRHVTSAIANQRYTKEGISTTSMIEQWLESVLLAEKSKAEMKVIDEWKISLDKRYALYAPVGSTLKRKNRLINFTEQSYLAILQALNTARLRQKNLQMSSATLRILNPPVLPISAEPTKRKMMVMAAYLCTMIFILGFFVLIELLDRTLRDKIRAERITEGKVVGALPGKGRFGERRYTQQYREIATRFLSNAILNYISPNGHPNVINILSTEAGDGKSHMMEHLAAHLRELGMKVRTVSWNKDFNAEQRDYLLANNVSDFVHEADGEISLPEADIVLVEYPPLSTHIAPKELLRSAALNIMVAPANRTWKGTDQHLYEQCGSLAEQSPLVICLNNATRDVVEEFTGLLPPYNRLRKLGYQISQFGFTGVK